MRDLGLTIALVLLCTVAARADCEEPAKPVKVSVEALASGAGKYLGKTVTVSGSIENEGRNYFTDLRVVLKDEKGYKIYVRPWLPVSLPPGPPGVKEKRPGVLSDFLGKKVELSGVVRRGELGKAGEVTHLEVTRAAIVQ
jgi:hypothetical protein